MSRRAVFVGGSSGIGFATARRLAAEGWEAVLASRSAEKLAGAAERLGGAETHRLDMTDAGSVAAFAEALQDGSVDALLITASGVVRGPFESLSPEAVHGMFASKFLGPFRVAQALLPKLRDGGSITFCSGVLSRRGGANVAALGAVNAAVEGLTKNLAKELGPRLRVNCLSPGMTRTEAYGGMPEADREAMFERVAAGLPAGRVAEPDDVAAAAALLMTNPFMTGHVLDVDGGHMVA